MTYEELRYLTMLFKSRIAATYGADVWDNEQTAEQYRSLLEDEVKSAIKQDRAVIQLAKEMGSSPDDYDIIADVDQFCKDLVEELGGMRKYRKYLAENNMTDSFLRLTLTTDYLESALLYAYTEVGRISNDTEEIFNALTEDGMCLHTRHIFVSAESEDRSKDESRALIEAAYEELKGGASFSDVMLKYNEDTDMDPESGMHFIYSEVDDLYFDTAKETRKGKYSEVVSAFGGYIIIERVEVDIQYVMINLSDFIDRYQYAALDMFITEKRNSLEFVPNEFFNSIDLTKMK